MATDAARALADSRRAVVVAAAGCGKTETIAQAVAIETKGCQLVLTHTHAGVRALRDRLQRLRVAPRLFHIDTIAGWALGYAASYPVLSGLGDVHPTGEAWATVYGATSRLLANTVIRDVVARSYAGLYVDEYQDCTKKQHQLVMALAEVLPCRVLGDPLQGIFGFAADPLVKWSQDVEPYFERLADLVTPWRWHLGDPRLGERLLEVRRALQDGEAVDLTQLEPIRWRRVDPVEQRAACLQVVRMGGSAVAIHKWAANCHEFAQGLSGTFTSMEEMDCRDLMRAAALIEGSVGAERARRVLDFACWCMTVVSTELRVLRKHLEKGDHPEIKHAKKYPEIALTLAQVAAGTSLAPVAAALEAIERVPKRIIFRRELWKEMFRALEICRSDGRTLPESAWEARSRARRLGRSVEHRTVSRTLLVKGLEFEHAVVLNADGFEAKDLYVAMTRGTKSLTVLSAKPVLRRAKPTW